MPLLLILVLVGGAVFVFAKPAQAKPRSGVSLGGASGTDWGAVIELAVDVGQSIADSVVYESPNELTAAHEQFVDIRFMITREEKNLLDHREKLFEAEWWNRGFRLESIRIAENTLFDKYISASGQADFERRLEEYRRYGVADFGTVGLLWIFQNNIPQGQLPAGASYPVLSLLQPLKYSAIYTEVRPAPTGISVWLLDGG